MDLLHEILDRKRQTETRQDEEGDERLREEAARWNKKASALVRPVTTYWTRLGEVQAKINEIKKSVVTPSVNVDLLAEKQKLQ